MKMNFDTPSLLSSLRFVVVGGLILVSLIPLALVSCVVEERREYYREAVARITHAWGEQQRIVGPVILIPLVRRAPSANQDDAGADVVIMPERLEMRLDSRHHMRDLGGIFEAPALDIDVEAVGAFAALNREALTSRFGALHWDRATVAVGVSDARGIRQASLQVNDADIELEASADFGPLGPGLRGVFADLSGGEFALSLTLRGSEALTAVPVGDRSTIAMASTWPHPSFVAGRFSPDEREIKADGFTASWSTLDLAHGFPGIARVAASERGLFAGKDLGFSVVEPVGLYRLVERSVKYGVLFVVLTLVSVLCLELATGRRFHVVQYGVTGAALVLFFLTLLALAEHVGFTWGYAAAAVLLTGMIGAYARGASGDSRLAALAVTMLAVLYGVLYTLLRLESFALLVGTGVLLLALAMLMWVTRRLTPTPSELDEGQREGEQESGASAESRGRLRASPT